MKIIFCSNPLAPREPDEAYMAEVAAAKRLAIGYALIDHDALAMRHDAAQAVQPVPAQPNVELSLYRGWMLKPAEYRQLYEALAAKGVRLLNDPAAYVHCHYLPESYPIIAPYTARSVWLKVTPDFSMEQVHALLRPFGAAPVLLKDFVKSQKHYWTEACYIPSAADREAVARVVRRFLELQGDDLNEGLVFREFVELEPLARHSRSGMPLTKEFRIFCLAGEPVYWLNYWEEGDYAGETPPVEQFRPVARQVKSRFFSMDVAKRLNGEWLIVELGDGQVAGLPEQADPLEFYKALVSHWPEGNEG